LESKPSVLEVTDKYILSLEIEKMDVEKKDKNSKTKAKIKQINKKIADLKEETMDFSLS
jgi:hypothetical protein